MKKNYFEKAKEYLLSFDGITEEILNAHLNEWTQRKQKDIKGLYKSMLGHASNRQGMPNSIGDVNNLRKILYGFNVHKVIKKYSKWEELFDAIAKSNYTPPGRMERSNQKNYWVIYTKAILSASKFLRDYESISDFDRFVESFYVNEHSRLALPLLLEKEIFGFGFALACDFLKENGYPEFIKPDTHIMYIANGLGITKSQNPYTIFKDVIAYSREINVVPYSLDKAFWLVGSGKFYLYDIKIRTSKKNFVESLISK